MGYQSKNDAELETVYHSILFQSKANKLGFDDISKYIYFNKICYRIQ